MTKHLWKMLSVRGGARNQNIFKEDKNERQTSQDAVHHVLERGASVAQTKRHAEELRGQLKGVMMAVLGIYPLRRSRVENTWESATLFMKSQMFGTGY